MKIPRNNEFITVLLVSLPRETLEGFEARCEIDRNQLSFETKKMQSRRSRPAGVYETVNGNDA